MIVQPFDLGSCPRVEARAARATRAALAGGAALANRWEVELPPLGSATVSVLGVRATAEDGRSPNPALAIRCGVARGRLVVEAAFACRLVDATLGGAEGLRVARALGPAERGLLVGLLGGLLAPMGWSVALEPPPAAEPDMGAFALRLETPVGLGHLDLQLPSSSGRPIGGREARLLSKRLSQLPIVARLEIAETHLRVSDMMGAAAGDAVVFEDVAATPFGEATPWPARLAFAGGHGPSWPAEVDPAGNVQIVGYPEMRKQEERMSGSGDSEDGSITAALAAAPIQVVAELGRITLRGEELAGLAPGAVFALGGRGTLVVTAAGERWAEGEIVDVDGELGIRITRVLRT
jgi:flagellar motor switch/type III secretory pathway protein FliN